MREHIFQDHFKTSGFSGVHNHYPRMLFTTDGVGTKIELCDEHPEVIGNDVVAMVLNDIYAAGGVPEGFLNYVATGDKTDEFLKRLAQGMSEALGDIPCVGGETAIMPEASFDVVGFAFGRKIYYEQSQKAGDILVGIPSNGLHSNGFTAFRRQVGSSDALKRYHELLVKPTRIYGAEFTKLMKAQLPISLFAHITGGGLKGNIERVLKPNIGYNLNYGWKKPDIFNAFQFDPRQFNMGIGFVFAIREESLGAIPLTDYEIIGRLTDADR